MNILAHRGLWTTKDERNTPVALERAMRSGFGVETDVRDYCQDLVISHDIAHAETPHLEQLIRQYDFRREPYLALNIKSDGIGSILNKCLKDNHIENYFFFDMSFPEMYLYEKNDLPYFTRQSEFEKQPLLYDNAVGVWMDEFETEWITENHIKQHMANGKLVAIISPEIHKKPHESKWGLYRKVIAELHEHERGKLLLCTDLPEEARRFFHV